jgi:chromate transport protein ChrA
VIAGALFILPSLFILMGLSWIYLAFGQVPAVAGVLYGIKPAVTAIAVFAAYRIGARAPRALRIGFCGASRRWLSSPSSGWIRHFR